MYFDYVLIILFKVTYFVIISISLVSMLGYMLLYPQLPRPGSQYNVLHSYVFVKVHPISLVQYGIPQVKRKLWNQAFTTTRLSEISSSSFCFVFVFFFQLLVFVKYSTYFMDIFVKFSLSYVVSCFLCPFQVSIIILFLILDLAYFSVPLSFIWCYSKAQGSILWQGRLWWSDCCTSTASRHLSTSAFHIYWREITRHSSFSSNDIEWGLWCWAPCLCKQWYVLH